MDTQASGRWDTETPGDGAYLRRAQALLAARGELFVVSTRSARLAGIAGPSQDRAASVLRSGGRQLTLPLPRERGRQRARMVG